MSDQPNTKEYSNGEVTIVWNPGQCIHTGICLRGLPSVFDLKKRPWIDISAASSEEIVALVKDCPSKALSIKGVKFKEPDNSEVEVVLIPRGPLIIRGGATVHDRKLKEVFDETVSFCRCGRSKKLPYCDGTHAQPKAK